MKQAFTLIELIISIVVIGLAFSAIPLMLQQESKIEIENIKQEAVMIAIIKAGNILSYAWDEAIAEQRDLGVKDKVLDVKNGLSNYDRYPDINSTYRIGHFKGDSRRSFYANQIFASEKLQIDTNDTIPDDMDDLIGDIFVSGDSTNEHEYKDIYKITTTMRYVQDYNLSIPSNNSTNIKEFTVTIKDSKENIITSITAFSTNIGQQDLLIRSWE
ncbi:type II secretion system protein [Hydrogenimonas thermophila]|uniref:pilus assembly FimT family protein n=1 Tax=Hydrogenimonas thermophila TaxID=223786 RepID=UPI002936EBE3|nr:type II secretion system protein [Hydrogenimonas thermophila]WOE70607.1 type II secretion system protein [Hydrogenimonas thermophila]WOE73125.1 type II secretion system protein [Hydrogenimonas thermophila]